MITFDIKLTQPSDVVDWHFLGGEKLAGIVTVHIKKPRQCRRFAMYLDYRTLGKYKRSREVVSHAKLKRLTDADAKATTHQFQFSLTLPFEPWSYEGELFRVEWRIQMIAAFGWLGNQKHQVITIRPKPPTINPHDWT